MKRISALELRQSLGKIITMLERTGEPIILEKGRRPVAALISLKDFNERFVEKAASEERDRIVEEIKRLAQTPSVSDTPVVEILRELRGS